jgi:lipopolysaccharide export LptBFGC system permease protein LptF
MGPVSTQRLFILLSFMMQSAHVILFGVLGTIVDMSNALLYAFQSTVFVVIFVCEAFSMTAYLATCNKSDTHQEKLRHFAACMCFVYAYLLGSELGELIGGRNEFDMMWGILLVSAIFDAIGAVCMFGAATTWS